MFMRALFFGLFVFVSSSASLLAAEAVKPVPLPADITAELGASVKLILQDIQRLRKAEDHDAANAAQTELNEALTRIANGKLAPSEEPTLQVIGHYEGLPLKPAVKVNGKVLGGATVKVANLGRPVILVLSGYSPITWNVELAEGAVVQKVLLCGYHPQTVEGLDKSVPVHLHYYQNNNSGRKRITYSYSKNAAFIKVAADLKELTGHSVDCLQGQYRNTGAPIVIGPTNTKWLCDMEANDLKPLTASAEISQRAEAEKELGAIRFRAVVHESANVMSGEPSLAEFTPTGPVATSYQKLPKRVALYAHDPTGPTDYGIINHDVVKLDLKDGKHEKLAYNNGVNRISWPSALTFDSKNRRLLVSGYGGRTGLYAYYVDKKEWKKLAATTFTIMAGIAWSDEDQTAYAIARPRDTTKLSVVQIDEEGKVVGSTPIQTNISLRNSPLSPNQVISVGKRLMLITAPQMQPDRSMIMDGYLIDPGTGAVLYHGKLKKHPGKLEFEPDELAVLWQRLGEDPDAENVIWKFAAGQEVSVEYVAANLRELPKPDESLVKKLIAQLDDDEFKIRDAAYQELEKMGGRAGKPLQDALRHPSLEVKTQAQRLILQAISGTNPNPDVRREVNAVRALGRINTPPAIKLLDDIAEGEPLAARTVEAQRTLERLKAE